MINGKKKNSNLTQEEDFEDVRVYKHKETGDTLQYRKDFENYESFIPKYGKTMNQLNETGEWEEMPMPKAENGFSYNACCKQTLESPGAGPLSFKAGHAGAGVAFRTAWGDGYYPVYQKHDEEGDLLSVEVVFDAGLIDEYNELIQEEDATYPPHQLRVYTDFDEIDGKIVFNYEAMRADFEVQLARMKKKFES